MCSATGLTVSEEAMKPPSQLDADQLAPVLDTNVAGLARIINAFLPLLEKARAGRIVNVSSNRGSMTILRCALVLLSSVPCKRSLRHAQSGAGMLCRQEAEQGGMGVYLPYGCSKAAVSALTASAMCVLCCVGAASEVVVPCAQVLYAKEFYETKSRVKINAVCPGYCKTAFNAYTGHRDPADGARIAVKMALLTDLGMAAVMHIAAHMPAHF